MPEPTAPAAPAVAPTTTEAAPAPQTASEAASLKAELAAIKAEYDKKKVETITQRRKLEGQIKDLSPKAQRLAELEKRDALAKLNPPEYLKSIYGDKWYDTIVESKLNGAPPANVIESELSKMRDEFRGELTKRDEASAAQQAAAQKAAFENEVRSIRQGMVGFAAQQKAEYPALEARHATPEGMGAAIFEHIKSVWNSTTKLDEAGRVLEAGKALSPKEAADALEAIEMEYAQKLARHEKTGAKLREVLTPAKVNGSLGGPKLQQGTQQQTAPQQPPRRTLSNDITGSTPGRQPATTNEERRRRAIEAFNAVHKG